MTIERLLPAKLAELESRAGASDTDREAWLAERRNGPTATEIRDLYLGKLTVRELVDRKLGRTPEIGDLSHIPVIGWGKEREPIIAAEVERRYWIAPESRVFKAADHSRKLASPDGVGLDFDDELLVSEIKTAGKNIAPGTDAYRQKGYEAQMMWVMRVLGARRCLYAWEYRLTLPGMEGFVPGELSFHWIEWDEALAKKLEDIADGFLAALDAAASETEPEQPEIDEELDTLAVNYLRGLDLEKQAKELKEPAYRQMLELLDAGEPVVQVSPLARVSFTPAVVEERPLFKTDYAAARAAAPAGLYERLEQAEDDLVQAQEAREREAALVSAYEAQFVVEAGTDRVVTKKATLRVTAAKETKSRG